MDKSIGELKRE